MKHNCTYLDIIFFVREKDILDDLDLKDF